MLSRQKVLSSSTTYNKFTNIRLSNRVTDDAQLSPYYAAPIGAISPDGALVGLSYANVGENTDVGVGNAFFLDGVVYVAPPAEYFDFPSDVFDDDGNYILKAWAEDDDGTRISPVASIELSVQEGDPVTNSAYAGYVITRDVDTNAITSIDDVRSWADTPDAGHRTTLSVESLLAYHSG